MHLFFIGENIHLCLDLMEERERERVDRLFPVVFELLATYSCSVCGIYDTVVLTHVFYFLFGWLRF